MSDQLDEADPVDRRPPRQCIKCGRQIGPDESICEICNRAGMATPAATQVHATMVVAIVAGVVLLALWAGFTQRDEGPFEASVTAVSDAPPDGALVTLRVTNLGSSAARARCSLTAYDAGGGVLRAAVVVTPAVPGGESVTVDERLAGLPQLPDEVAVSCS